MTERTLRSFDSDFRGPAEGGVECLRFGIEGGEADRGGVDEGEAHSVDSDEKIPLLVAGVGSHELLLLLMVGKASMGS